MKYNELNISSNKSATRVGRGIAAGKGKTAGRGTKGQGARTGFTKRPGFEGGQNPLMQRLPKLHGFRSHRPKAEEVYTGQLDQFAGQTVDTELLAKNGLVTTPYASVKLLVGGELTKKVIVKLQAASTGAVAAVQKAGGSFESVSRAQRPSTKPAKEQK
jgi:large subunit ribosomal protein L15